MNRPYVELDADRTIVEQVDPLLGTVLDGYRVDFRIAVGGFGAIYRGTHLASGTEVALKILHARLARDPSVVARFRREGAALVRLRHPNTVRAYELGEASDGTLYLAMELLHGESLLERFETRGPLPWQDVVAIARAVCGALDEAHGLGIVHRDLKPGNIHLEDTGVKVLDFGIAKIVRGGHFDTSDLTHAGQMVGTYDYMAPEQMVGGAVDARSDIYALGVVMHELIAGRRPFHDAKGPGGVLAAVLGKTPPLLSTLRSDVPLALAAIVARCLSRDAAQRFPDVRALATTLATVVAFAVEDGPTLREAKRYTGLHEAQKFASLERDLVVARSVGMAPTVAVTAPRAEVRARGSQHEGLMGPMGELQTVPVHIAHNASLPTLVPQPAPRPSYHAGAWQIALPELPAQPERRATWFLWLGMAVATAIVAFDIWTLTAG